MILANEYKNIADNIDSFLTSNTIILEEQSSLDDNFTDLKTLINTQDPNTLLTKGAIDLQNIKTSINALLNVNTNKDIQIYVKNLQKHVLKTYSSIDSFLSTNNIKVKNKFAELSNSLGFSISISNIE